MKKIETMAMIEPFEIQDVVTGIKIKLTVSKQYSVLSIDDRSYYFYRENGKFDGTSKDLLFKSSKNTNTFPPYHTIPKCKKSFSEKYVNQWKK